MFFPCLSIAIRIQEGSLLFIYLAVDVVLPSFQSRLHTFASARTLQLDVIVLSPYNISI